jgi:hypothetical protein
MSKPVTATQQNDLKDLPCPTTEEVIKLLREHKVIEKTYLEDGIKLNTADGNWTPMLTRSTVKVLPADYSYIPGDKISVTNGKLDVLERRKRNLQICKYTIKGAPRVKSQSPEAYISVIGIKLTRPR